MFRLSIPADSRAKGQSRCPEVLDAPKCRKRETKDIFLVLVRGLRPPIQGVSGHWRRPVLDNSRIYAQRFPGKCPRLIGCPTVTKTGLDCQVVLAEITGTTLHCWR